VAVPRRCAVWQTRLVSDAARPPGPGQQLHAIAVELAAMAQNGLTYATDRYELARYRRLQTAAAEILAVLGGCDPGELHSALAVDSGHATPKVDVRGALFDEAGQVLLVREKRDGRWTLPGGWADALDPPAVAVEREFAEEAGLAVRASHLVAVHDGSRRNGHGASPWHVYKLFFRVERLDRARPVAGLDGETTDVGFFAADSLPPLSIRRCTTEQLHLLWRHHADPRLPTAFD
jgi:ADP-ribose pyrophosphatase YjhB (NUDIX family)